MTTSRPPTHAIAAETTVDAPVIDLRERRVPARQPVVEAAMPTAAGNRAPSRTTAVAVAVAAIVVVGFYVALPIGLLARSVVPQTVFLAPALIVGAVVVAIRRVLRATEAEPVVDLTEPRA